jgi:hypothetical protein
LADVTKPDERQPFLVQDLEVLHAGLLTLTLGDHVPVGVRQLFETAKNTRLYTYFVFRFHQVAEMLAYQSLERALKERWNSEIGHYPYIDDQEIGFPTLSDLLETAVMRGWIRSEGFRSRGHRAHQALMSTRSIEAIIEIQGTGAETRPIQEPTESELREWMNKVDVADILAQHIPDLRNSLAHGSARLSPTSDLLLTDLCDAINMLFDGTPPTEAKRNVGRLPGMHGGFKAHIRELETKRRALLGLKPSTRDSLPRRMPERGVYLFSENGRHLYVGRSNAIRKRIGRHCRPSAKHNMASFAFLLARESAKLGPATYRKGKGRKELMELESAQQAFAAAKMRIRAMDVRFVEETDPIRQALLELYVSVVHQTHYNDFDTH